MPGDSSSLTGLKVTNNPSHEVLAGRKEVQEGQNMNVVQNEQIMYLVQEPVSESYELQAGGAGGEEE